MLSLQVLENLCSIVMTIQLDSGGYQNSEGVS